MNSMFLFLFVYVSSPLVEYNAHGVLLRMVSSKSCVKLLLKASTELAWTHGSLRLFQSLMVLGKNDCLNISVDAVGCW